MDISLIKVHGSENDFFIVDELLLERPLTDSEMDRLRKNLCDRSEGLLSGADGLLLIQAAEGELPIAKMRVINSDGSEASMCGNGLRTVARYLSEKENTTNFIVETMHADLKARKAENIAEGIATFQVEISPVSFEAQALPMSIHNQSTLINKKIPELSEELYFSAVAVPNPHLISFVSHEVLESTEQERIASYLNGENHLFPDGVNVSFVEIMDRNEIFVKTYERGVGFTNACGTAMCASSLMYVLLKDGNFFEKISVRNPGGMVKTVVHQDPDGSYWMELIGNATFTHRVSGNLEELLEGNFTNVKITETDEQSKYEKFLESIL